MILERFHDEVTCFLFGGRVDVDISCAVEVVQNHAQRLSLRDGLHAEPYCKINTPYSMV